MKKRLYSILIAAFFAGTVVPPAGAAIQVSVDFFHDHLQSHGDWREVGDYGYCWQPRDVDRDWRPYSDGRWIYTDAGWTWDSDEPYSWAVYHYGRWARVARVGWVWVPGTEWGPAWVSWRRSPRHVGWAPLPPEARFTRTVGISSRVDVDYDIGPTNYNFVEVRTFGAPRLRTVLIEPRQNITIIHQTTNITKVTYVNNVVYNEGPQYEVISRESAQPIRRLRLERREELDGDPSTVRVEQLRSRVEGDSLRVVALPIDPKPAAAPKKVAARVEKVEVDRGWKDAGPPAEVAKVRTKIKSEPAESAEPQPATKPETTVGTPAVAPDPSSPASQDKEGKGKMRAVEPASPATPTTETAPPVPGKPGTLPPPEKVTPTLPEKAGTPALPAEAGKPGKGKKPVQPEATGARPVAPGAEEPATTSQPKKGNNKGAEASRPALAQPPAEAVPAEEQPGKKPKSEATAPTRTTLPDGEPSKKGKSKNAEVVRPAVEADPAPKAPAPKKEKPDSPREMPPAPAEAPRQKNPDKKEAQPQREIPEARTIERNVPDKPERRPESKKPEPQPQPAPAAAQPEPPKKEKGKGKDKEDKKEEGAPQ